MIFLREKPFFKAMRKSITRSFDCIELGKAVFLAIFSKNRFI